MGRSALEPPDLTTIGGRLRWAREKKGYSSARAAAAGIGVNENTYKAHEQGERGKDGLKTKYIETYSRALGINPVWLLTGKGGPDPKGKPDDLADDEMLDAFREFLELRKQAGKL